jgi:DNA-directed RNA polymerase specialized sigma24 family protein
MRANSIVVESADLLFERAFEAHWDDVFRFSLTWTNDWAAAEDMAHRAGYGR